MAESDGALSGMRVIDLTEGLAGPFCTRLMALFGAEVIKVERPDVGDWARRVGPFFGGVTGPDRSTVFAYLNANKRSLELDLDSDRGQRALRELVDGADVVVESFPPGYLSERGLGPSSLRETNPSLVVTSLPDTPEASRFHGYRVNELTLYAMTGLMSLVRGLGRPPIKAGGYQAHYMAGLHTCALTLFAAYRARCHGAGCWIDTSAVEATAKAFAHVPDADVAYRSNTEAGREPTDVRRERANCVLPCKEGHVTVTLYYFLMKRLGELLGIPELTEDPRFDSEENLHANQQELRAEVKRWLSTRTADEAQREAQSRHLLFTKVNDVGDLLRSEHLRARSFFRRTESDGENGIEYPGPPFIMNEAPAVPPMPAPRLGEANERVRALARVRGTGRPATGIRQSLPLEGVRILDLTHRHAGPTMAMLLGDWGADVIKIEWWSRMDAWRGVISIDHDPDGNVYNAEPRWLRLNRSKRSLTLNLKSEKGKQIFLDLVRKSDVVMDNFSAGVLDRLGLGYDVLSAVNPRITKISMPGVGSFGPHAHYVTNGATVEGYGGLASMTGYEDGAPRNSIGCWPDPVAGVHGATAVAMALWRREETGRGQSIELSQAESLINLIGEAVLACAAGGAVARPAGNSHSEAAPHGVYPCAGEDAWIAIEARTDKEWKCLCEVTNRTSWLENPRYTDLPSRLDNRQELDSELAEWTRDHDAWALSDRLQQAGVTAGPVVTAADLVSRPGVPADDFWVELDHPHERLYPGPAARMDGAAPEIRRPPPDLGAHTEEVLNEVLGLDPEELERLRSEQVT